MKPPAETEAFQSVADAVQREVIGPLREENRLLRDGLDLLRQALDGLVEASRHVEITALHEDFEQFEAALGEAEQALNLAPALKPEGDPKGPT